MWSPSAPWNASISPSLLLRAWLLEAAAWLSSSERRRPCAPETLRQSWSGRKRCQFLSPPTGSCSSAPRQQADEEPSLTRRDSVNRWEVQLKSHGEMVSPAQPGYVITGESGREPSTNRRSGMPCWIRSRKWHQEAISRFTNVPRGTLRSESPSTVERSTWNICGKVVRHIS